MKKLKKVTINDFKKEIPEDEFQNILKSYKKDEGFKLVQSDDLKNRDDSLIDIEIAFRKCKRVGAFD